MEHNGDADFGSTISLRKQNEKYVPLDIENENDISNIYASNDSVRDQIDYHSSSSRNVKNPISAPDILKTLFFILVWYTFSTFLTM